MNKQIEEIKRIIDERCEAELGQVHANSRNGKVTKTVDTSLIAKDIYNVGYQKIDKDSVVLTETQLRAIIEEEYKEALKGKVVLTKEEYEQLVIEYKRWEKLAIEDMLKQERKETAREILSEVGKVCGDYQWFKNLRKQYGVEVCHESND